MAFGQLGRGFGRKGSVRSKASAAAFTPLAGAAIDMNFATGQYFGGTLANLMDGTQSNAAGALLTALGGSDVSVLLSLKAIGAAPDGSATYQWIVGSGGSSGILIQGISDTVLRTKRNATNLNATLGSGTFTLSPTKLGLNWTASGRALVGNNGTITTDVQIFTGATGVAFVNVMTLFNRLTVWTPSISNAALAAFTV